MISIDEPLFAHINNDAFLEGSYGLQGRAFQQTIGYLNQYLEGQPTDSIPEDVRTMQRACNRLVSYQDEINTLRRNPSQAALSRLAQTVHQDIIGLQTGEYLLMPGGWSSITGGHAIIYQFSLNEQGDLLFSINNSGSGLQFHGKKSDQEKELYNPVLTYKIPKARIADVQYFPAILAELVTPQIPAIHKQPKIEADYLYQRIFPKMSYLDGEIIQSRSFEPDYWHTAGQLSGTCAQRSLHQMLKSRFATLDDYRRFIYGFKACALDEYIAHLKREGNFYVPRFRGQIEKAIRHQLRLLNLSTTVEPHVDLFSAIVKEKDIARLTGYLSELKYEKKAIGKKPSINKNAAISSEYTLGLPYLRSDMSGSGNKRHFSEVDLQKPLVIHGGPELLAEMGELLQRCQQLAATRQHQTLFEQLEQFFLHLPLPENSIADPLLPFYSAVDSEEKAFAFYKKINELQALYFKTCDQLLSAHISLPRMYLVKMSLFAAVGHVNQRIKLTKENLCFHDLCNYVFQVITPGSRDAVYLANQDPEVDNRWVQIKRLYKQDKTESRMAFIRYYQSLLNNEPELIPTLEERYRHKYGSNHSEFHEALRKHRLTALYYFTEHREEFEQEIKFKPLLDLFKLQEEMEKSYASDAKRLIETDYTYVFTYSEQPIKLVSYAKDDVAAKSPFSENQSSLGLQPLQKTKYPLPNKAPGFALGRDIDKYGLYSKRNDNLVQLLPGEFAHITDPFSSFTGLKEGEKATIANRVIDTQDLEERELFHLRRCPSIQIPLTLDYFNEHLEKLTRHEMQVYLEANLFQPGLLLDELHPPRHLNFFEQFDKFIENGLKHYAHKGLLSLNSVAFIRLAYLVNQYAAKQNTELFRKRLDQFSQKLHVWITTTPNEEVKASLHQYRLLTAVAEFKLDKPAIPLTDALQSCLYIQVKENRQEQLDIDTRFKIQSAKHEWMRILREHQAELNPQELLTMLHHLGIVVADGSTVSGHYPVFTVLDKQHEQYTIHVEQGLVYKGNMAYGMTPMEIRTHPVLQQLGIKEVTSCFISADGKMLQIEQPPHSLRFIKEIDHYNIEKLWDNGDGCPAWYQLMPLSRVQQHFLQLPTSSMVNESPFADVIKERNTLAWVRLDKQELLLTDAQNGPAFRGQIFGSGSLELRRVDENAVLLQKNTWIHQLCQTIEDPKFITVTEKDDEYTANLARYHLRFSIPKSDKQLYFTSDGHRYQYQEGNPPLGEGTASMLFSDGKRALCLLPIQRFINTDTREADGEYYQLRQDTQAAIPHKIVEKLIGKENPQFLQCFWQYSDTERYIVLSMKAGKPIPETPAEALYLCYVYLGSNQPEKAWEVLDDCDKRLGGLTGQYDELKYLSWICNNLNLPRALKEGDEEAIISNPPFVACKLKALSLLAAFTERGKSLNSIEFPAVASNPHTVNDLYTEHSINETKKFYQKVNESIYSLYTRMQAMRREMPAGFTLTDSECKQLLNLYHDQLPAAEGKPKAVGALGYEWVRLHLKTLRQELTTLSAKAAMRSLTPYEQRRQQEISDFVQSHQGVSKVRSDLEYRPIDLSLPPNASINTGVLNIKINEIIASYKDPLANLATSPDRIPALLQELTPSIIDDSFLEKFPDYLYIATRGSQAERVQLEYFCKATLIAHRHVPLDKQTTNIPLLCNVLYRIICSNKPLPTGPNSWNRIENYQALLRYAMTLTPKSITVPQLVDKTDELLVNTSELWRKIPEPPTKMRPEISSEADMAARIPLFSERSSPGIMTISKQWRREARKFRTGADETTPFVEEGLSKAREHQAGKIKYQALTELKKLANTHLQEERTQRELAEISRSRLQELSEQQSDLSQKLLKLASLGPENPTLKRQWQIDLAAAKRAPLDMTRLLTLYFHADITRYQLETGLSITQINQLHSMLTQYVALALHCQQLQRILNQLQAVNTAQNSSERAQGLFQLADVLFSENTVSVVDEPALSLFQYYENILLRPQQQEAISRLLATQADDTYSETIEKIIMGGGKSKVILPTLAQKKATGSNLVIIEVPRALLQTNFVDLKATSAQLYNQNACLFEFNRDSDCSPERLQQLYNKFTDIMVNQDYLVTTGDALQSLELKYLELLANPPEIIEKDEKANKKAQNAWEQQVHWADKLILLLRNRGDLIIDEVHQGLLLKNKLNYTMGESGRVSQAILQNTVKLYQFFQEVRLDAIAGLHGGDQLTLHDVLKNNKLFTKSQQFKEAAVVLAKELVNHEKSPLHQFIQECKKTHHDAQRELEAYLLEQGEDIPQFIMHATPSNKEKLALYKEQISHLLPATLKRNQGEHYGPSQLATRSPEVRVLAIPYLANNVPNERSRFGNYLEAINYTIQSLIITGAPKDLVKHFLENLQIQARKEMHEQNLKHLDETSTANLFELLTTGSGLHFSDVDLDNEQQLDVIHQCLTHNDAFIYEILKTDVLKQVRTDATILHSDAYNHVDLVRSCQGMTGTPWNYSTFHQRLQYDAEAALGTDGYIIAGLQSRKPQIHVVDFINTDQFVKELFARYPGGGIVQATMDINASFKGIDNLTVAKTIAHYIYEHPEKFTSPQAIKYILFFNDANQLAAIPVSASTKNVIPVVIGSSNPEVINERLGCGPEARFTFYDQAHTVGADIKQSWQAKGIAMIDPNTHLSSFLQGVMRMRGLIEGNQSLDLIVPASLAHKNLDEIMEAMDSSEQQQLKQDNFEAARLRMNNLIRATFMKCILDVQGERAAERKRRLFELFKEYFIDQQSQDFFTQYGDLNRAIDTDKLLYAVQDRLLADWRRLMTMADVKISVADEKDLHDKLHAVVEKACKPRVCEPRQFSRSLEMGMEVEVQKEVQVEVFIEKEVQKETFDPFRIEVPYQSWRNLTSGFDRLRFKTLNDICKSTKASYIPEFNQQIKASENFYWTYYRPYQHHENFIDMHSKPVHGLMFMKKGSQLFCTLLTQQECEELIQEVNQQNKDTCWISTTQHTLLAGTRPESMKENKEYQSIIEQVRYFNGDFQLLLERDVSLDWLTEKSKEKLDFFAQFLNPCRETLPTHVRQVTSLLSSKMKVYQFIASNPEVDYSHYDWKSHFPDSGEEDIEEYKQLSQAFNKAARDWWHTDLTSVNWQREYGIPFNAMGYLGRYVTKMNHLRLLITNLADQYQPGMQQTEVLPITRILHQVNLTEAQKFIPAVTVVLQKQTSDEQGSEEIEKQNYWFVASLLREIPQSPEEPRRILFTAIAQNKNIEAERLNELLEYISKETFEQRVVSGNFHTKDLLLRLLLNASEKITPEIFRMLMSREQDQDEGTLPALANHRWLEEQDFLPLLEKAKPYPAIKDDVLLLLIKRQDMTLSFLKSMIAPEQLNQDHISAILDKYEMDRGLLNTLVEKAADVASFKVIVTHAVFQLADAELLKAVINKCQDVDVQNFCLQHNAVDETVYSLILVKNQVPVEQLRIIAGCSSDPAILQQVLQKSIDAEVLKRMIENSAVTTQLLTTITEHAQTADILKKILKQKNIVDETVLAAIAVNPYATDTVLGSVTQKTRNIDVLKKIDSHPNAGEKVREELENHPFAIKTRIRNLLQQLQEKTEELIEKGTEGNPHYNRKYKLVAEAAQRLNEKLNQTCQAFFAETTPITRSSLESFELSVKKAIKDAKKEFASHRGTWYELHPIVKGILGVLAGITLLPMLGFILFSKHGYKGTFFVKPSTASLEKLQSFESNVEEEITSATKQHNELP